MKDEIEELLEEIKAIADVLPYRTEIGVRNLAERLDEIVDELRIELETQP